MPYVRERNTAERSGGPDYLDHGGIQTRLEAQGCKTKPVSINVLCIRCDI